MVKILSDFPNVLLVRSSPGKQVEIRPTYWTDTPTLKYLTVTPLIYYNCDHISKVNQFKY